MLLESVCLVQEQQYFTWEDMSYHHLFCNLWHFLLHFTNGRRDYIFYQFSSLRLFITIRTGIFSRQSLRMLFALLCFIRKCSWERFIITDFSHFQGMFKEISLECSENSLGMLRSIITTYRQTSLFLLFDTFEEYLSGFERLWLMSSSIFR